MSYLKSLFNKNFLEYASYVIRDRAIPELIDGLKPVQRRILHTLFEIDDGRMHKVASVAGDVMHIHPHGDQSIMSALVVLANKEYFIDKQGNFGNIFTGDAAAAGRYIECRIAPFAKEILLNPNITQYVPSYDGRKKEPVAFRAKLPLVLLMGAEGIAVGMATTILPHNIREVIQAEIACLTGKPFQLYPDFQTGGSIDVSEYDDGVGKILARATIDTSDPKKVVITDLPYGSTTRSMMASIENAAKAGRIKIADGGLKDFTSDRVNIEIKLQRGVYAQDVVDALYAFTECEKSISCNLLVIDNNMPRIMTVTEVIKSHAKGLLKIFKDELEFEKGTLTDKLHMRTLERIFIEERIYKKIETMKTEEAVNKSVIDGFEPFKKELIREVTLDDIEHLLRIPIRRISLYDINKNRKEVEDINTRLKEIAKLLKNLTLYAVSWLDSLLGKLDVETSKRRTKITKFGKVDAREAVQRDTPLKYDPNNGYLGIAVSSGNEVLQVTPYDRILIVRRSGVYTVTDVPDRLFVDKNMWYCNFADKELLSETVFTIVFKDTQSGYPFIKRCRIEQFILNKDYLLVPETAEVFFISTEEKFSFTVAYEPKARIRITTETFKTQDYEIKGLKTLGIRLASRTALSAAPDIAGSIQKPATPIAKKKTAANDSPSLFDAVPEQPAKRATAKSASIETKTPAAKTTGAKDAATKTTGAKDAAARTAGAKNAATKATGAKAVAARTAAAMTAGAKVAKPLAGAKTSVTKTTAATSKTSAKAPAKKQQAVATKKISTDKPAKKK